MKRTCIGGIQRDISNGKEDCEGLTSFLNIFDIKFDVCSESRAFMTDKLFSSEICMGNWSESMLAILKACLMVEELILQMTLAPLIESICMQEGA